MEDDGSRFNLRLPRHLRIWIGVEAAKGLRSVNSEIITRLERSRRQDEQGIAQAQAISAPAPPPV